LGDRLAAVEIGLELRQGSDRRPKTASPGRLTCIVLAGPMRGP